MLFSEYMTFLHYRVDKKAFYIQYMYLKKMFLIHGNQTTCDSCLFLLIFLFNLLSVIIHKQPGVRRSWGRRPGSFSSFDTCIDINIMSFSLHKHESVKTFFQCAKVDLIVSWNDWKWKILKTCFYMRIGELKLQVHGMIKTGKK